MFDRTELKGTQESASTLLAELERLRRENGQLETQLRLAEETILQIDQDRRALERQVVTAADDQQRRIGQELHDGVQQELTAAALMARTLIDQLEALAASQPNPAPLARVLTAAQRLYANLVDSGAHIRDLAHGLVPLQIEANGLQGALSMLAASQDGMDGVQCTLEADNNCDGFDSDTASHLYRIGQEAVCNARRHSGASLIKISLYNRDDAVVLEVTDDGEGLDLEAAKRQTSGIGLRTMQYRAGAIGGEITIAPRTGGGTTVRCVARKTA